MEALKARFALLPGQHRSALRKFIECCKNTEQGIDSVRGAEAHEEGEEEGCRIGNINGLANLYFNALMNQDTKETDIIRKAME